jgi:hypothetical protein
MEKLMSLQNTEDRYEYEKLEITSVTKQFTNDLREVVNDPESREVLLSKLPDHIMDSTKISCTRVRFDNTVEHKRSRCTRIIKHIRWL